MEGYSQGIWVKSKSILHYRGERTIELNNKVIAKFYSFDGHNAGVNIDRVIDCMATCKGFPSGALNASRQRVFQRREERFDLMDEVVALKAKNKELYELLSEVRIVLDRKPGLKAAAISLIDEALIQRGDS